MRSTKNSSRNKIIGIVGGMGPYAGMDLEMKIFNCVNAQKDQDFPDVITVSVPSLIPDRTQYILDPENADNPSTGIELAIKKLVDAGATHIAIPCNTAHSPIILKQIKKFIELNEFDIEFFNIIEETYKWTKANCKGKKIVLYATFGTYHSKVYNTFFDKESSIEIVEPAEDDKQLIWDAIYSQSFGVKAFSNPISDKAVENFKIVTEKMIAKGYDTFIMGCTEIPLAMGRLRLPITTIDPAKILARALVKAVCPSRLKA